jgi:hypothetical protein
VTRVLARSNLIVAVAVAAAAGLLVLTACNSSGSGDSTAAANNSEQAKLDFSQCMRDNGVPNFPDPVAKPDGSFGLERPPDVSESALDDALKSCQSEAQALGIDSGPGAQGADTQDALLEFSRCMRENGLPEFPDPEPNGDLRDLLGDYDLESPRVSKAMESCQPILDPILEPLMGGGG